MDINYLTIDIKNTLLNDIKNPDVFIDIDIQNYITIINQFPFICTTQCCQGHPHNGYLSVMINENIVEWFEKDVIIAIINYCDDIVKRFERISENVVNIRYIFLFKPQYRDIFFKTLINNLSEKYIDQ